MYDTIKNKELRIEKQNQIIKNLRYDKTILKKENKLLSKRLTLLMNEFKELDKKYKDSR